MRLTSGVCVVFYKSHGGPVSPTKRSAVVLTSRRSLILSAPVISSFLAILPVLIHPWITVEPLGPVWPLCQETGIVLPANPVIHGSGRWSLTLHHSTLVWQPPIDEPRTVKHAVLLWERLRSTPDKPHDDDVCVCMRHDELFHQSRFCAFFISSHFNVFYFVSNFVYIYGKYCKNDESMRMTYKEGKCSGADVRVFFWGKHRCGRQMSGNPTQYSILLANN